MTLGEKIFTLRKRMGYSQEELAFQLGVSRQTVSKWETDFMKPEVEKIVAIGELFNVSTDMLLIDKTELPPILADVGYQEKSEQDLSEKPVAENFGKKNHSLLAGIILSAISILGIITIILVSLFSSAAGDVTVIYSTMYVSLKTIFYLLITLFAIGLALIVYKCVSQRRKRKKDKE